MMDSGFPRPTAKPRDLDQAARCLLDHLQGGLAEMVDDPLGHLGADPLDQSRAEVAADPLDGRRQHGVIGLDLELTAILGMARPERPRRRKLSPGCAPSSAPTTVSRSLDRLVATRAMV
jgi:hypothetical protein